jgi:hypothetical protein
MRGRRASRSNRRLPLMPRCSTPRAASSGGSSITRRRMVMREERRGRMRRRMRRLTREEWGAWVAKAGMEGEGGVALIALEV